MSAQSVSCDTVKGWYASGSGIASSKSGVKSSIAVSER